MSLTAKEGAKEKEKPVKQEKKRPAKPKKPKAQSETSTPVAAATAATAAPKGEYDLFLKQREITIVKLNFICVVQFQKIFNILPHRRDWNCLGGGGGALYGKKFKEMYEA